MTSMNKAFVFLITWMSLSLIAAKECLSGTPSRKFSDGYNITSYVARAKLCQQTKYFDISKCFGSGYCPYIVGGIIGISILIYAIDQCLKCIKRRRS